MILVFLHFCYFNIDYGVEKREKNLLKDDDIFWLEAEVFVGLEEGLRRHDGAG
jgi:hypothetical protein